MVGKRTRARRKINKGKSNKYLVFFPQKEDIVTTLIPFKWKVLKQCDSVNEGKSKEAKLKICF